MTQVLSVISGKGGVGKTLLTAALGIQLSRMGKKVLLIDGDMGLRNLDLILGVENECFYNIWDLAQGKCFIRDAILSIDENLYFLSASQGETWEEISSDAINTVLEDIDEIYDFILIDCPAGIGAGIKFAAKISDFAIIVLAPSWASKRNAEKMILMMPENVHSYIVLNQFSEGNDKISFEEMMTCIDEDIFGGVIPFSRIATQLSHYGELQTYRNDCAFADALQCVVNVVFKGREYPISRWRYILHAAKKENGVALKGSESILKKRPIFSWDRNRMAYKWRHRR